MQKLLKSMVVLLVFVFVSCTSSKSHNDSDTMPDADPDDIETVDDDADPEEDSDFLDDSDETETQDEEQVVDECEPPLSTASFPYHDKNGNITFCRPGCDEQTEKNPQCVDNLWKIASKRLYAASPESECKDSYPCDMSAFRNMTTDDIDALEAWTGNKFDHRPHECDTLVNATSKESGEWWGSGYDPQLRYYGINDGKVGVVLKNTKTKWDTKDFTTSQKTVIYDVVSENYRAVTPASANISAYYKGCFFFMGQDFRYQNASGVYYLIYACDDGRMELAYPVSVDYLWWSPAINEKWAVANIQEKEDEEKSAMYARIGEWKWTKIYPDRPLYYPNIVKDKAVFSDPFMKAYYCDLSKNPQSLDDCIVINEDESEEIERPVINKDNDREVLYGAGGRIKRLKIKENGEKEYSVLLDTFGTDDGISSPYEHSLRKVTDDMVYYSEHLVTKGDGDVNTCFYNRKSQKVSCMKKIEGYDKYHLGAEDWEGKWMLYQLSTAWQIVRDLDCYCEKEGVCPFAE